MMLAACRLSYRFPGSDLPLLNQVSLRLSAGNLLVLKGVNGSGKTTLCKLICGALVPEMTGKILLNGQDISRQPMAERSCSMGIVFQDPDTQLFMPTVADELAFGLENPALPPTDIRRKVQAGLDMFSLTDLADKNPRHCSGGERQKIVLAAVVIRNRPLLILDEAFSQMDDQNCLAALQTLLYLKKQGTSILAVDHQGRLDPFADAFRILEAGKMLPEDEVCQ